MVQFSFNAVGMTTIAKEFEIRFPYNRKSYSEAWDEYCENILDALSQWCRGMGIKAFSTGFTQIAIQITFANKSEAMLFKLTWHNAGIQ
jgi:hypothetical protein